MSAYEDALAGREVEVDFDAIERTLSELWRVESDTEEAVTRAALWNVIAHASTDPEKERASDILSRASGRVPQRTILVRASFHEKSHIKAWISANCHLVGGGKQMCSEEITIVAGGDRVLHVPPLVEALLLPNVPVVAWWIGDLPTDLEYVEALMDSVNRLIVDSSEFNAPENLRLLQRIVRDTSTWPADLNWTRIEEWRTATACIFDSETMSAQLGRISEIRITASSSGILPDRTQAMLYLSWLAAQGGYEVLEDGSIEGPHGSLEWSLEDRSEGPGKGALLSADFRFTDGTAARVVRKDDDKAIRTTFGAGSNTVIHLPPTTTEDLFVRQLSLHQDPVFSNLIPMAGRISGRLT